MWSSASSPPHLSSLLPCSCFQFSTQRPREQEHGAPAGSSHIWPGWEITRIYQMSRNSWCFRLRRAIGARGLAAGDQRVVSDQRLQVHRCFTMKLRPGTTLTPSGENTPSQVYLHTHSLLVFLLAGEGVNPKSISLNVCCINLPHHLLLCVPGVPESDPAGRQRGGDGGR